MEKLKGTKEKQPYIRVCTGGQLEAVLSALYSVGSLRQQENAAQREERQPQIRESAVRKPAGLLLDWNVAIQEALVREASKAMEPDGELFCCLPHVLREKDAKKVERFLQELPRDAGVVVRSADELGLIGELGFCGRVMGDSLLYAYNSEAARFYLEAFPQMEFLTSDELTGKEQREIYLHVSAERFIRKVYGHQLLMITDQCISKSETGCKAKVLSFRDEKGRPFTAVSHCDLCYSVIYQGNPVCLLDRLQEIPEENILLDFTIETAEQTERLLREFGSDYKSEGIRENEDGRVLSSGTRGHFYQGID